MENLTIDQRKAKIQELASDDISVALNLKITKEGIEVPVEKSYLIAQNHFYLVSAKMESLNDDFQIPTDTNKYDITEHEFGTSWKRKNTEEN